MSHLAQGGTAQADQLGLAQGNVLATRAINLAVQASNSRHHGHEVGLLDHAPQLVVGVLVIGVQVAADGAREHQRLLHKGLNLGQENWPTSNFVGTSSVAMQDEDKASACKMKTQPLHMRQSINCSPKELECHNTHSANV
jgi:hypothetical protein